MIGKAPTLTLHKKLNFKKLGYWEHGDMYKVIAKNAGFKLAQDALEEGDVKGHLQYIRHAVQAGIPLNYVEIITFHKAYTLNLTPLFHDLARMRMISMDIGRTEPTKKEIKVANEACIIVRDGLYLLKKYLFKGLGQGEHFTRVFYLKMKAELLAKELIVVNVTWANKPNYIEIQRKVAARCMFAFKLARKIAIRRLSPTCPLRIGLALSMAEFCYTVLDSVAQADKILGEAFLECQRSMIKTMILDINTSGSFQVLLKVLRKWHRFYYFEHERQKRAAEFDKTQEEITFGEPLLQQEEVDVSVLEGWHTIYECEEGAELSFTGEWEEAVAAGHVDPEEGEEDAEDQEEADGDITRTWQRPSYNFYSMFKYMQVYHRVEPSVPGRRHSI